MESIGFILVCLFGMVTATNFVSRALGAGTEPVVFLLVFSTFSGYLNNLFDRHPLIHVITDATISSTSEKPCSGDVRSPLRIAPLAQANDET